MPPIVLPPKVYKILAPAIKGCVGGAREVKFEKFINVFKCHFECTVHRCKSNSVLITPPTDDAKWPFPHRSLKLYKPKTGCLNRQYLQRLGMDLHSKYSWDHHTFVCGSRRSLRSMSRH